MWSFEFVNRTVGYDEHAWCRALGFDYASRILCEEAEVALLRPKPLAKRRLENLDFVECDGASLPGLGLASDEYSLMTDRRIDSLSSFD